MFTASRVCNSLINFLCQLEAVNGLQWKLIHETWLHGREGINPRLQPQVPDATLPEPPLLEAPTPRGPRPEAPALEAPTPEAPSPEAPTSGAPTAGTPTVKATMPASLKIVVPE